MHAPLPPEILSRIVHFTPPGPDLAHLCLASHALLAPAQAKLYHTIHLSEPHQTFSACTTLTAHPRLAALVSSLWVYIDPRRTQHRGALPRAYWDAVRGALTHASALRSLVLFDSVAQHTWVLAPPALPFQLAEAKIKFLYDDNVARFLHSQKSLTQLHLVDHPEPLNQHAPMLPPNSLPELREYEGPAYVAAQLANSPITHMQACLSRPYDRQLPRLLSCIPNWPRLRALNILNIPNGPTGEDFPSETTNLIATYAPHLHHLGAIPLPIMNRTPIHRALTRFPYLRVLEIDLQAWLPQPPEHLQRTLASELRVYCPTLEVVAMWLPQQCRADWHVDQETHEWSFCMWHGQQETLWKMA
ncbi:hypothetical protein OE88DRAFT_1646942 [Heliocybe sulcata]|uniref:F-box domain-containing protein n=1 Tax=Heliocybe sulcata TaxID=5364 RepID=A0A5C3MVH8_9AGAM|nr:hypothetical protein OE88DRAFT_1646942 [Heliocybe sulcata]